LTRLSMAARRGLTHTREIDVVRIEWLSPLPMKLVMDRLNKESLAFYQDQSGKPKHFDDLVDLALPTDDWQKIKDTIEPARGPSEYILDHIHPSTEYRYLYDPNAPNLDTRLYTLVPPMEDYSVLHDDISNAIIFPNRLLVLERVDGNISLHYDLPSSQIDISKPEVKAAALRMDARLDELVRRVLEVDEVEELEKEVSELRV